MSPVWPEPANPVVVTGMGVVCSIAADVESFPTALRRGCSGIEPDPWGADGPPFGAVIRGFSLTSALAARRSLPERLLQASERAVRRSPFPLQVAAATALEAWEGARLHDAPVPGDRLGLVVAGNNLTGRYAEGLRPTFDQNPAYLPPRFALHVQDTDHVGTLSEILGITGEGFTVGGASASGNLGIIHGSRLVEWGAVDACLVVGALAEPAAIETQGFVNAGAMACRLPSNDERAAGPPFDRSRRGFILGQGCASLVLETRSSATRRGAAILAEVGGYALKLDGHRLAEPAEEGEATAMTCALRRAGLEPRQVSYVNAHGSGSASGDETEMRALRRAFGTAFGVPWVNATKSLTGHCLGAAGVLEAVATVVQMREGFVHPNAGLTQPIDAECRLVRGRAEPVEIRHALSNSFGFGGINTSLLLADPRPRLAAES